MANDGADDLNTMALCAIRYTIGRRSYIVSDGVRWARAYGRRSAHVRSVLIRDLEELVTASDRAREQGAADYLRLGDEVDEKQWRAVLAELKAMPNDG